jgi:hypothetical protein
MGIEVGSVEERMQRPLGGRAQENTCCGREAGNARERQERWELKRKHGDQKEWGWRTSVVYRDMTGGWRGRRRAEETEEKIDKGRGIVFSRLIRYYCLCV